MAMTPRQRVLAALHHQPTDKTPFTCYENKMPQCTVERRLRNAGMCILNRRFPVVIYDRPHCVTESFRYQENGRSRVRAVTRTPVGEVYTVNEPAAFTSWTIEHAFKRPEDYKVLRFIAGDTHCRPDYEAFAEAEKWTGEDQFLRVGAGSAPLHHIMIHLMGVETFAVEWMENRDEILQLETVLADETRQAFSLIADSPATHANIGGNESPEVMGPARYREYCLPLFNECADIFHKKGKLLGSHMDANNKAWAADVAKSGLDYIEAFTPAPGTDMTLAEALAAWPDKVLWINFPSSVHLSSIEVIKQTARELIEAARGSNRFILGITEDMPPDRWQGNMLAISEVIDEMAG